MDFVTSPPPPAEVPDGYTLVIAGAVAGDPPFVAHDAAYFLRLIDRVLPDYYIEALKTRGGYEIMEGIAAVGEEISRWIASAGNGSYITWATTGAKATATIALKRANATRGAGIVKAGTIFSASSAQGRQFVLLTDVPFGLGDVGPHAALCESDGKGAVYNVQGPRITARGEIIAGQIDTIEKLVSDPPYFDPTIEVVQTADAAGGRDPFLEQIGIDRGLPQEPGENEEQYRARLQSLPDTISPLAIKRAVWRYMRQIGVKSFWWIEPFTLDYQGVWSGPNTRISSYDPLVFYLDDTRTMPPFFNRWLSIEDDAGSFIVLLPNLPCFRHRGFFGDDPGKNNTDLLTKGYNGWRRSFSYGDMPQSPSPTLLEAYPDAWDQARRAVYGGVNRIIQAIKEGGVEAGIEIEGSG